MISLVAIRGPEEPSAELERAALAVLSPEEKRLAGRFHFDADRRRFVCRRAARRLVLGRALGRAPSRLSFEEGKGRKPRLEGARLSFNCSSSGSLVLIGLCVGSQVGLGVDVERHRTLPDWRELTRVHMPELLSADLDPLEFLRAWTRKEAYLKARGVGLSVEPRAVRLPRTAPCAIGNFRIDGESSLHDAAVALAYEGPEQPVAFHEVSFAEVLHE